MTRTRIFVIGFFSLVLVLAAVAIPRRALSIIMVGKQSADIAITVYVGTTPAPTALPSSEADGSEEVNVNINQNLPQYFQPSNRNLVFAGSAGQTITQNCAEELWVSPGAIDWNIEDALSGNFKSLSTGGTMPYTALQWQASPSPTVSPAPTYTPSVPYATDGNAMAVMITSQNAGTPPVCVNVRISIPAGTPSGVYYSTLDLEFFAPSGSGAPTSLPSASPSPTPAPTVPPYVYLSYGDSNGGNSTVAAFNSTASGNIAPAYTFSGSLSAPTGVTTDSSGNVYVLNSDSGGNSALYVFAPGANPSELGSVSFGGTAVGVSATWVALDGTNDIYVSAAETAIAEFAAGSWDGGSTTPITTLQVGTTPQLTDPEGIAVGSNGTIYVANTSTSPATQPLPSGNVLVFAAGSTISSAPIAVIGGSSDGIGNPQSVGVDAQGNIYVLTSDDGGSPSILVFAPGANGNATPSAQISGSNTELTNLSTAGMAVDPLGGIYVANNGPNIGSGCCSHAMLYFAPGSNGNAAPTRVISGSNTGFVDSFGFAGIGL